MTYPPFGFRRHGFTLIELLTVMAVIAILAALTLQISGFVQKKAAMSRADAEIHAMEAACEGYKSDNGIYPRGPSAAVTTPSIPANVTDTLDARVNGSPSSYTTPSLYLYMQLSGDQDVDGVSETKSYMQFKPDALGWKIPSTHIGPVLSIQDPWGNSYGYSTINQVDSTKGYNPTFDLWSTAGKTTTPSPGNPSDVTLQWIKNW